MNTDPQVLPANIRLRVDLTKSDKHTSLLWYGMEQRTLRNVKNYLNTNIYSYLETSGGQSSNLYLKVVHFFNSSVN